MSWIPIDSLDLEQGNAIVKVYDDLPLTKVLSGWALYYNDVLYELDDGEDFDADRGWGTLRLTDPWVLPSVAGASAIVVPINTPYRKIIDAYTSKIADIERLLAQFAQVSFASPNQALVIAGDGSIEPVGGIEFFQRTGLMEGVDFFMQNGLSDRIDDAIRYGIGETSPLNDPVGTIIAYRFDEIPAKYLVLDGSSHNYNDYPALGFKYGAQPGQTFQVEDYRGLPLWGNSAEAIPGAVTGSDTQDISHNHTVTGTTDNAPAHGHAVDLTTDTEPDHTHGILHTHPIDPPPTESSQTGSQAVGLLGVLSSGTPPNDTVEVDIPEFTSGNSSLTNSGAAGSHDHDVTGNTHLAGGHSHALTGETSHNNAAVDKRPRRGIVRWLIRAVP